MGLFGKKKNVEPPPVEDIPPLPTLETLHRENQLQQSVPKAMPQLQAVSANQPLSPPPQVVSSILQLPKNLPPVNLQTIKKQEPPPEKERPAFAPLFVKIDRYRNILNALGQLRTSIVMIRNSFSTLNELEKARFETLKLIEEAVGRVENKLSALDSELLRPAGHHPEISPEYQDVETVQATVADLKGQIEQLKTELEQLT